MTGAFGTADKINTILLFVTMLGVFAAYLQLRANTRNQRTIFFKDILMQLRTDPWAVEAFYQIEYGEFAYESSFHGTEIEKKIDRLLTMLDLVCEMYFQRAITQREMNFFNYQARRIASNQGIIEYFKFLSAICRDDKNDCRPFSSFQKMYMSSGAN